MTDDSYRGKVRATFLAAIMVLSMVAMSATLVAPAAAQAQTNDVTYASDGTIVYQGQDVYAFGDDLDSDAEYNLREATDFDAGTVDGSSFANSEDVLSYTDAELQGAVDELGLGAVAFALSEGWGTSDVSGDDVQTIIDDALTDANGDVESDFPNNFESGAPIVEIETDDLDAGNYYLAGGGLAGEGTLDRQGTFEVTVEGLTAEFDDPEDDFPAQNDNLDEALAELELDSDRGTYSLNVSASGLDNDELFDAFAYADLVGDNDEIVDSSSDSDILDANSTLTPVDSVDNVDDEGDVALADDGTIVYRHGGLTETTSVYEFASDVLDGDNGVSFPDAYSVDVIDGGDANYDLSATEDGIGAFNALLYNAEEDDDDETILLKDVRDPEDDLSGIGLDEGTYDLQFSSHDTSASATSSPGFEVGEEDVTVDFGQDVYETAAGDVVRVTADLEDTEEAYVQFGGEDSDFTDILYIEDDDDDDQVEFYINTRLMGTSVDEIDADTVYSPDDVVYSFIEEDGFGSVDTELSAPEFVNGDEEDDTRFNNFDQYLEELDLIGDANEDDAYDQLIRPLQATSYDLRATGDNIFYADDEESSLEEEDGFATVTLQQPELGELNTWVGPEGEADDADNIAELVNDTPLTQREDVAIDDLMVAQIEADGLYGMLTALSQANNGAGYDAIDPDEDEGFEGEVLNALAVEDEYDGEDLEGEGIEFTFEDADAVGNQDENEIDLTENTGDVYLLPDNEAGELYVVVDTDAEPFSRDINDGDEFEVSLEYQTDGDERFEFRDDEEGPFGSSKETDPEAYPYFTADQSAETSTTFTFEDPDATFDNAENDVVRITPSEDATISGTTNVAPDSSASVRVRNTANESSFLYTEDVSIDEDGSFSAEIDASDRNADEEAVVEFRVRGDLVADSDAVFGEAAEEAPFTPGVSIDVPSTVAPGDTMEASVTAENTGDVAGNATLSISVAGEEQFSETVSLDAGASTSETVSYTVPNDTNASSVSVSAEYGDASDSATVTIEQPDDGDDEQNGGTPGFGIAVAALALLSAALLARFRN